MGGVRYCIVMQQHHTFIKFTSTILCAGISQFVQYFIIHWPVIVDFRDTQSIKRMLLTSQKNVTKRFLDDRWVPACMGLGRWVFSLH